MLSFRRLGIRGFVLGLSAVMLTSGCGLLGDQKKFPGREPIKVAAEVGQACVKQLHSDVKNWLKDGRTDIGRSIDCTVQALDEFTLKVTGTQSKASYTEAELATFMRTFLAEKGSDLANDSNDIIAEILKLKRLFIGGADHTLSKAEFKHIRDVLIRLKPKIVALSPQIPLIFFGPKTAEPGRAAEAGLKISDLITSFADEIEAASGSRPIWTTEDLLHCFRKLGFKSETVDRYIPVVNTAKGILVGGEDGTILGTEWTPLLDSAARTWSLALRLRYDLAKRDDWLGAGFSGVEPIIGDSLHLLSVAVQTNSGSPTGIPREKFEKLVDGLAGIDVLPEGVTAGTLKDLLPVLFGKILYGRSNADWHEHARGFAPLQLEALRGILSNWLEGQKIVLSITNPNDRFFAKDVTSALQRRIAAPETKLEARLPLQMLAYLLGYGRALPHDSENRLIVLPTRITPPVSQKDLTLLNAVRVLMETVIRGYSRDPNAAAKLLGITEAEAEEIYVDTKPLGKELNLMDIRNQTAGARTFMEASIFTSTSNGDAYMSMTELVEWFHFVLGGGLLADKIHADALKAGCGLGSDNKDVLGKERLRYDCFQTYFAKSFDTNFTNLPRMVTWARADKTGERYKQIVDGMMKAGRQRGLTQDPIESSELRSMIPILHYAESLFARHDTNENNILDDEELWDAFPILQPFIKKLGNGKADAEWVQRGIFSWILTFGEPPAPTAAGSAKLLAWIAAKNLSPVKIKEHADRGDVLKVMASFVTAARNTRKLNIENYDRSRSAEFYRLFSVGDVETARQITSLFQCLDGAAPVIRELLMTNAASLAPGQPLPPEEFRQRLQSLIGSDSRLESLCLPF